MQSTIGTPLVSWEQKDTVCAIVREGRWDADLISASFNPYVAGEILKISLPATGVCDSLFRRYDAKGQYAVRDGCRLQRGIFSAPEHQTTHPNEVW